MSMTAPRKIFCVGFNKTGTTSLEAVLRNLGFRLGNQSAAEWLIDDWAVRDFSNLIRLCATADAFQDIPFSLPFTFQALDQAFPGSKFILTVRASSEEWFDSLVRFHTKLVGTDRAPSEVELQTYPYCHPGWLWRVLQLVFEAQPGDVYNRERYISVYERHNNAVRAYFAHRPGDLLELRIDEALAMPQICRFLDIQYSGQSMPHLQASH